MNSQDYNRRTWIRLKDREPQGCDYPLWAATDTGTEPDYFPFSSFRVDLSAYTHWQSAIIPAPPTKPTQADLDTFACLDHWKSQGLDFAKDDWTNISRDWVCGWTEALYWERNRVKETS
jgi:hypothetical protein